MDNPPRKRRFSDSNAQEKAELLEEIRVYRGRGLGKTEIAKAIGDISPRTAQTGIEKLRLEAAQPLAAETVVTNTCRGR